MIKEIKGEDFRKMQLTELDMLVEFDKVCRKYNINYVLFGGSLLGAVRHQGYIPWDDDADIGMLREDYETFKKHKDEMNPNICFFQDHDTDPEYRWEYGKLRRTGSTYIRVGQEHLKCKTGIFVDVFPMDDIPLSIVGQIFQDLHCYCLRKILWSEVAKENTVGFWKVWFTLLSKIPVDFAFHGCPYRNKAIQNLCKGKTVIVVAHRLSALKMCNRVAVVENHTITNVGTHEEVRKTNAYYRKAWDDYETARNITYQLEGGEQYE